MKKLLATLVMLILMLCPSLGWARCSHFRELVRFGLSLQHALRCQERELGLSGHRCRQLSPPDCSDDAVVRLVELAYGAAPDTRVHRGSAESRCQRAISREIERYVWTRLPGRTSGQRSVPRPGRLIDEIERSCADAGMLSDSSGRLPAFSGACAELATDAEDLDEEGLARCLRASVEAIIDDIAPSPLTPNIILILTDDQRWDTLEYMPNVLETLAERGIRFSNGFVTSPICAPSRASILSGAYAHSHGIIDNDRLATGGYAFDHANSIGRWLSAVGYKTAFFGKYLNGAAALQLWIPDGWDEWQIFLWSGFYEYWLHTNGTVVVVQPQDDLYSTDYLKDQAVAFIEENQDRPFFLVYSPFAAHAPAVPPERHRGTFAGIPLWRPPNFREPDTSLKPLWIRFKQWINSGETPMTDGLRIKQLESLLSVDEAVRNISDTLEELGLTDNTLIVFTSDNGYHWGEHWGNSKFTGYEESIRVPYLVRYPLRYPVPGERDPMVLNIDLAPTFAELAGAPVPPGVDGQSLLPVLDGSGQGRSDFMFESFTDFVVRPNRGVRTRRWKYIRTDQGPGHNVFKELYDLENDPYELDNLAYSSAYAEILDHLAERLEELQSE